MNPSFHCYTDGSCKKSEHSPGGWGVYVKNPQGEAIEKWGHATNTDSTTMELTAVAEALCALPLFAHAVIYTDSKTVIDFCSKKIADWQRHDFRTAPAQWCELLKRISETLKQGQFALQWRWLQGHRGNEGNERADALAAQGAREAKRLLKLRE